VILNAGECYLVQGSPDTLIGSNDLSGTLIKSNNPIGVLSGHVRTAILQNLEEPADTKDHFIEMLPPTRA